MHSEFKGVFPALITPMSSDGKLNESALRQVMEFNIKAGVHGFWVAGGSGESVFLEDEENPFSLFSRMLKVNFLPCVSTILPINMMEKMSID